VTAFYVMGGLFAVWAVVLTAIGIRRENFPRPGPQTFAVGTISVVLAACAIGSGIIGSALHDDEEHEGEAAEPQAAGEGGGRVLAISADPGGDLSFDTQELEARAGDVTIRMENPSTIPHNVSIEGSGVDEEGKTVEQGGTSTVSADVQPGEYVYYCSVPGHREAGMEGTLTVR
jgi:plastocyanin